MPHADWIPTRAAFKLPNTYYIVRRSPQCTYTYTLIRPTSHRYATHTPLHRLLLSFILKLFKLVIQSNTYNFTIMAIVAVLLIATFRYSWSSLMLALSRYLAARPAHSASHITDATNVTPACFALPTLHFSFLSTFLLLSRQRHSTFSSALVLIRRGMCAPRRVRCQLIA